MKVQIPLILLYISYTQSRQLQILQGFPHPLQSSILYLLYRITTMLSRATLGASAGALCWAAISSGHPFFYVLNLVCNLCTHMLEVIGEPSMLHQSILRQLLGLLSPACPLAFERKSWTVRKPTSFRPAPLALLSCFSSNAIVL